MRQITVKYEGECAQCHEPLMVGSPAMYEKTTGIFCVGHEPTEVEDIRDFRLFKAEKKADRLNARSYKLIDDANRRMKPLERMRGDIAFFTQPGRIAARDRMFDQYDKGCKLHTEAGKLQERAVGIIRAKTRVAGDAERKRQAKRDAIKAVLKPGMRVHTMIFGDATIVKVNRKTATVKDAGCSGTFKTNIDLSFIRFIPEEAAHADD
jgi:hypothetical protein